MTAYGVTWLANERLWQIQERFGLEHQEQVLCLPLPPECEPADSFFVRDRLTGQRLAAQRSRQNRAVCFVRLSLEPGQTRLLEAVDAAGAEAYPDAAYCTPSPGEGMILGNGKLELRLAEDGELAGGPGGTPAGPVGGVRLRGQKRWRGRSFYDAPQPAVRRTVTVLEKGAVRAAVRIETSFAAAGRHVLTVTVDGGACFARMEETFAVHETAQMILDLRGADLPDTVYHLNHTPGYDERELHYGMEREVARLGGWSQQMQLAYSDGFAFRCPAQDAAVPAMVVGVFALAGGEWRGNRLNTLDAWVRRWRAEDPLTRRLLPPEMKADAPADGGGVIPARDQEECVPHLSLEGWLGRGSRSWGLLLCAQEEFALAVVPAHPALTEHPEEQGPLGHFENGRPLASYRSQQCLLRRLHIRHGVFPLQQQLALASAWEDPSVVPGRDAPRIDSPLQKAHLRHVLGDALAAVDAAAPAAVAAAAVERMRTYLDTRVETFWYGAGIVSTNPVSSRQIAPLMYLWEYASAHGWLSPALSEHLRTRFSFLAELFCSPTYYPGDFTMLPATDPDSYDPGLMGMANQNFFTDVYNIPGTAAAVFPGHPRAELWREYFTRHLRRQLEVHVYPRSGVWEESHTYYQHVLHTLLPLLLRRRAAGGEDWFADPTLRRMAAAALHQATPPDGAQQGRRYLVPFGDHGGDPLAYTHLWLALAQGVRPHDEQLAAAYVWMARETGTTLCAGDSLPAPRALPLVDEELEGLGVFFRRGAEGAAEELLALRSGTAWGHHHNDDGSFWLYGLGRMLIGDSAYGEVQAGGMKTAAAGHSRWTPAGANVQNHLWRCNRGQVVSRGLAEDLAWAVIFSPVRLTPSCQRQGAALPRPLRHWRAVARLGEGAYLLLDRTAEPVETELHFHWGAPKVEWRDGAWTGEYADGAWIELRPLWSCAEQATLGMALPASGAESMRTQHLALAYPANRNESGMLLRFGRSAPSVPSVRNSAPGEFLIDTACGEYRLAVRGPGDYHLCGPRSAAELILFA